MISCLTLSGQAYSHVIYAHGGIVRGDTTRNEIHLIFTGHEFNDGGKHIRKVLKRHQTPAHFFFTGDFYRDRSNRKLINRLKKDGHYLGAHSDKHLLYASWEDRDSLLVDEQTFTRDLDQNYSEMKKFGISKLDAPYYMPPYEWYNSKISEWTQAFGLTLVNFTYGTRSNADYTWPEMGTLYVDSETIYASTLDHESDSPHGLRGFLLLVHIGTDPRRTDKFYSRLDSLLTELKARGYTFTLMNF